MDKIYATLSADIVDSTSRDRGDRSVSRGGMRGQVELLRAA